MEFSLFLLGFLTSESDTSWHLWIKLWRPVKLRHLTGKSLLCSNVFKSCLLARKRVCSFVLERNIKFRAHPLSGKNSTSSVHHKKFWGFLPSSLYLVIATTKSNSHFNTSFSRSFVVLFNQKSSSERNPNFPKFVHFRLQMSISSCILVSN